MDSTWSLGRIAVALVLRFLLARISAELFKNKKNNLLQSVVYFHQWCRLFTKRNLLWTWCTKMSILFLTQINDLPKVLQCFTILFADDTTLQLTSII